MFQEIYIVDKNKEIENNLADILKKDKEIRIRSIIVEDIDTALKDIPDLIIINEDALNEDVDEVCKRIRQNEDNSIYRNKVKICENIKHCKFTKINKIVDEVEKEIIEVHIVINGAQLFESTNEYVLRYW